MKILVMSLLRIGDVAMATPVLSALRLKFGRDAQIDLLVNSQAAGIAPLISGGSASVGRVIVFDREAMQRGLGRADIPFFDSYERLNELVDRLNGESYDLSINLTHSRLSGWMMSLVNSKEKMGLVFDGEGRASFGTNWFRYLNSQVEADGAEVFHFTEVFRFGLGLGAISTTEPSMFETENGKLEAAEVFENWKVDSKTLVAIQALTSDSKKDWGLARMSEMLERLSQRTPDAAFVIIGAPSERERLEPMVNALSEKGVGLRLAIVGLEGAFSLVKRANLLISVDTSIKHFAACAGTPILEISLGSSDPYRTGAYRHGSLIVKSRELCSPCVHSKACHREKQFCAMGVPSDAVAMLAGEMLAGRSFQLRSIAEAYREEIDVLTVDLKSNGVFAAASILEPFSEQAIGRWIDLTCRKLWLESQRGTGVDAMGSEALKLGQFLRHLHPTNSDVEWKLLLTDLERQVASIEGRLNSFKTEIRALHGSFEDPRRLRDYVRGLISFREKMRHSALLSSFRAVLDLVIEDDISPPFTRFRRIVDAIGEIDNRTQIHLRLIRSLGSGIEDIVGVDKL